MAVMTPVVLKKPRAWPQWLAPRPDCRPGCGSARGSTSPRPTHRGELLVHSSCVSVNQERLILVVEDDDATRSFLLDNLAADGFRVAGASGAGEALRAIEVCEPALVVLD